MCVQRVRVCVQRERGDKSVCVREREKDRQRERKRGDKRVCVREKDR